MTEVAVGNQGSSYIPEGSVAKVGRKERTHGIQGRGPRMSQVTEELTVTKTMLGVYSIEDKRMRSSRTGMKGGEV